MNSRSFVEEAWTGARLLQLETAAANSPAKLPFEMGSLCGEGPPKCPSKLKISR